MTSNENENPPIGRITGLHDHRTDAERLVLHPVGELDYFAARRLMDALQRHLSATHTEIVLDLTSLSFCDSSGVSLATSIGDLAAQQGIEFELRRSRNHVGRVFDLLPA